MPDVHLRREVPCLALLLLVWVAVCAPRISGPIDLRWDASVYYVLGTSLAKGQGYRLLNEPGQIEAVQYPPALPLLVAAHAWSSGTTDMVELGKQLRVTYMVLSGCYLLLIYLLLRTVVEPISALVLGLMAGLSYFSFLYISDTLHSELPFGLLSVLFLLWHSRSGNRDVAWGMGILGSLAFLTRTFGISLLLAWVLDSVVRGKARQAALRTMVSLVPILLWQGYIAWVKAGDGYVSPAYSYQRVDYYYTNVTYLENLTLVDPFRPELGRADVADYLKRVRDNVASLPVRIGEAVVAPTEAGLFLVHTLREMLGMQLPSNWRDIVTVGMHLCLGILGGLILAGCLMFAFEPGWPRFLAIYAAVSLGLIAVMPWENALHRYIAPLTPVLLVFLAHLLALMVSWAHARMKTRGKSLKRWVVLGPLGGFLALEAAIAIAFLTHLRLPVSYYDADGSEQRYLLLTYEKFWHDLDPAFEFLRRTARPSEIVATTVPHLAYVRTGLRAVLPPLEADPTVASRLLDGVPATYLVLDSLGAPGVSQRYAAPVVGLQPSGWEEVYRAPGSSARVFRRLAGAHGGAARD